MEGAGGSAGPPRDPSGRDPVVQPTATATATASAASGAEAPFLVSVEMRAPVKLKGLPVEQAMVPLFREAELSGSKPALPFCSAQFIAPYLLFTAAHCLHQWEPSHIGGRDGRPLPTPDAIIPASPAWQECGDGICEKEPRPSVDWAFVEVGIRGSTFVAPARFNAKHFPQMVFYGYKGEAAPLEARLICHAIRTTNATTSPVSAIPGGKNSAEGDSGGALVGLLRDEQFPEGFPVVLGVLSEQKGSTWLFTQTPPKIMAPQQAVSVSDIQQADLFLPLPDCQ